MPISKTTMLESPPGPSYLAQMLIRLLGPQKKLIGFSSRMNAASGGASDTEYRKFAYKDFFK